MSEELEKLISAQTLKQPSKELDDKILALLNQPEEPPVKAFPWSKVISYSAAALLFLSIGITEFIVKPSRVNEVSGSEEIQKQPNSEPLKVVSPTLKVSTTERNDNIMSGEVIELENGMLVKPMIREVIHRRTYYDKVKKVQVEVSEPRHEIFYVPVNAD